jgi:putative phosphoesterase
MRIGLISDIHGNDVALETILADMDGRAVDSIVCLGDTATIGPQPREVMARVKALGCPCIMGNHDSALLDPNRISEYQIAPNLSQTIEWCIQQISHDDLEFLRASKPSLESSVEDHKTILYFHGSPSSNIDQVLATTPSEEIDKFLAGYEADIFVGGHTHIQMLRQHKGKLIVNPGSVGSAFLTAFQPGTSPILLPWAEYAIIELAGEEVSVDLRRVHYDVDRLNQIVLASDLPIRETWKDMYWQNSKK